MTQPKKSFGQHFLKSESTARRIIEALNLSDVDVVVEIGPGRGALTKLLLEKITNQKLVLIEADRELVPTLQQLFPRAEIICADAARIDYDKIVGRKKWVLVSNLPYNAAVAIILKVLTSKNQPRQSVVMLQKEQVQRILG